MYCEEKRSDIKREGFCQVCHRRQVHDDLFLLDMSGEGAVMMGERLRKQPKINQSEASSTDELTRPRTAPRWDAQGAPHTSHSRPTLYPGTSPYHGMG